MRRIFGWASDIGSTAAGEDVADDRYSGSDDDSVESKCVDEDHGDHDEGDDLDSIYDTDDKSLDNEEEEGEEEEKEVGEPNGGVSVGIDDGGDQIGSAPSTQNEIEPDCSTTPGAGIDNDDAALEQTTPNIIREEENERSSTMREANDNNNSFAETKHAPPPAIIEEIEVPDLGKVDAAEIKQFTTASSNKEIEVDDFSKDVEIFGITENAEIMIDDSFPQARDFLVDIDDDAMTIANQATEIVDGFNDDDDIHDDARTIATQRTTATRVQPVSAAFRSAMTNIGEAEQRRVLHPHQSIFDILDRNFEELGDGGVIGGGRWRICHKDVKLCFVAFVSVFSLPSEPILSAHDVVSGDSPRNHEAIANNDSFQTFDANGRETYAAQGSQSESILQRVPLSVAFALWNIVLEQSDHSSYSEDRSKNNDHLSYIRSTLVLLGMLDLASIERDRDDGVVQSLGQSSGNPNKSIECLVVHDQIHQQYGEYLAWGDHNGAYKSLIEADDQRWNKAVMQDSKQIGSNQFTLRMLPLNTMRTNRMQETFDLLNDKTFVRRRIRVLGATGAAKAHVGDMDELLSLIEKLVTSGEIAPEPIDEREGLLGAYQQMRKYCLYETEELTKCHKDDNGKIKLGKTAMYKAAEMGNALHLLGASLGGYGFFDEEMEYYNEALQLKKLAVNGKIERSIAVSDTLHSMGFSLDNAGKKDEALECYDQALGIRYECLGDDDLRVAETQHNKGALLCEEDRAEEAMECLEEALRIREIHYGEEHESCADTMQWMGNCLRKHGDPSDALDYFKFALSIKRQRLGIDHIDVANTLFNTAVLLDDIEKFDLSLVAYKEALRIRRLVLGNTNQEVADTLFCMGNVAAVVKNHIEALGFYEESIKIREDLIREDDLFVNELDYQLLFLSNPTSPRADLLLQYKKLNESFEEALPLTKLIMGTNHPKVYVYLNRMGEVYMKLHDWDNAIGSFQGALRVKSLNALDGQDDLEVAALLQKKGQALLYKNEFVRAKATFDSAMQIHKKISGMDDCLPLADSTCFLGVAYYYLNDFSHAKLLFQECMRMQEKLVGEDDLCIVRSLIWLGRQHQKVKEPQKALERYLSALQICKKKKASIDYRLVVMLLHIIAKLYEDDNVKLRKITSGLQLSNLPPEPNPPRPNNVHRNTNTAIDAENHRKVNLRVLQKIDRNVFEVAKTATQIALFEYNNAKQTPRTKKNVEGSLFITKRSDTPSFKVTVLSRSSTAILEVPITASFQLHVKSPYLMFRDNPASNDIHGILFHDGKETDEIASYLEQVVKQEISLKCYNEEINLIHSKLDAEEMQTTRMLVNAHIDPGILFKERGDTERSIEHLETALKLTKKCDGESSFREGEIADHLGMLYASRSDFASAKLHYSTAYSVYEKTIGRDDLTTSDCAFRLGGVLEALQSNLASDFYKESLRVHRLNMAEDNERVGDILCCLARLFLGSESHQDAVGCFEEALSIRKRLLGDCSDVAETYHNLGKTYNEMSHNDKALIFYRESVRINKKISNHDALRKVSWDMAQCATLCSHYQLAIDCYTDCLQDLDKNEANTANVLQKMGEIQMNKLKSYEGAKTMFLDALELLRGVEDKDSGASHHIASLLLLIAQVNALAEDYENALDYYEEHISMLELDTPKNEDLVADSLHAMGDILSTMDKNPDYELAIEKLQECLDIKKKIGSDDERVANVMYTLATVYEKAGYHEKATESFAQVLRSFKIAKNKGGIVKVYLSLGRLKTSKATELDSGLERSAAIECYQEALKIRRQIMSLDDMDMALLLYEYANLLCMNNEHNTALPFLEEALRIQKSKNGLKDERVAIILLRMAEVFVKQMKYEASLVSLEQVLFIQTSLGCRDGADEGIDLGSCHYLLATTYLARDDYEKAISSYVECLTIQQNKFGRKSLECAAVHNDLGEAFRKVGNFDKAIESLVEALKIRKTELGNNSLDYGHSVFNLARVHIATGKQDQALNCLDEAIRVYRLFEDVMSKELAEVGELKGDTLCEVENHEMAISMYQECLLSFDSRDNEDSSHAYDERAARLNYKLGHALAKIGAYDDAFDSYREAIRIFSHVFGVSDLRVGDVMYDVGLLIVSQGGDNFCARASECFNEMIRIYGLKGKGRDVKVAGALVQKSTLLADCTEYDEAGSLLDEAIDIYKESLDDDAVAIGKAMLVYGKLHNSQGNNDEAMAAFDEALRIFLMRLGDDDINVSIALENMGIIHTRRLEYSEAVDKCKTALKIRVTRGEQDQDVADSVFNIGNILNDWGGREDEAYQYFQQALKLYIHLHGDEDISVAKCQQKLGLINWNRKDFDESLDSFLHALRICEQEDDEAMNGMLAPIYRGIGDCYYNKGEYDRALENFARCLRILKKEMGDDCIHMAPICDYIGLIYQKKERYEEAMNFHSKALLVNENHYGKGTQKCARSDFQIAKVLLALHKYEESIARLQNHMKLFCNESHDCEEVGEVYHSLGLAQSKVGDYEVSISSLNKSLDTRTKLFGTSNLSVAETRLDLAKVLDESGLTDEAIAVYDQAITTFQTISDSDSLAIASAYTRLGALFEEKGNTEASLYSWKKALKIYSAKSGSDSSEVGETLYSIGKIYDHLGNYDKSTSCFSETVKNFRSNGEDSAVVGMALGYVAKNYARKKQYAKAVELSTEALRVQKQFANAGDIAESLVDLGNILKAWGKTDQALQFFEEALRTYKEAVGLDAIEVAVCRYNIGILKKALGETDAALRNFGEALRIHRIKEEDKSLYVANNLFQIGQIYDSLGKKEKSLKCFEECLKIREEILGEDHLDVLAAQRLVAKKIKYYK